MRVLVVGDTCEDRFVYTNCQRFSPEFPIPVLTPYSRSANLGMAGNVVSNIRSLAPEMTVGTLFPKKPSIKTRYVDHKTNHHFFRLDEDVVSEPLTGADWLGSIKMCPDAAVVSDYSKGFLTPGKMHMIAQFCWANKIPLFADSKSLLSEWSRKITFVKINEVEFQAHLDKGLSPWMECQHLLVTKGGAGIDLYAQDGSVSYHSPGVKVAVSDVAGAGDACLAALVVKYMETQDIRAAMDWANKVGAVAVSKRGVVAVKREEVV